LGVAGATYTSLTTYQAATGRGSGDKIADPMLGSDGAPGVGSPAIDAGAALAGYVGDCTGAAWHYCGSAPDLGAVERSVASPPPPPPPPPPPVAAPVLPITSSTNRQTVPLSFTISATATSAVGIGNVTFWFHGDPP